MHSAHRPRCIRPIDALWQASDIFFTVAFLAEMTMKLLAFGVAQYVADGWNCLDGSLVTASLVEKALVMFELGGLPVSPTFLRMLRFLRIARLLKLIRINKGIKKLLATVP